MLRSLSVTDTVKLAISALLLTVTIAVADDADLTSDALALAVAQVAVNESGWESRPDLELIWQVTRGHGHDSTSRLGWLRQHCRCVLGSREPDPGDNCAWTRHLTEGDAEPFQWPSGLDWSRYVSRWRRVRAQALELVRRDERGGPCASRPDTWGGASDHARALRLGMAPLECRGSQNRGYLYPRPVARRPADMARGS